MASITTPTRKRLTPTQLRNALRDYHRRRARKARAARRQIAHHYHRLPTPVHTVFEPLAPALTRPTYHHLVLLALAAILTVGGRTIANLLRYLGALAPGHSRSYHRVLSHRRWSSRRLARRYITAVLARFVPHGPVALAGDDTVTEHPGAKVYGKGCHRDPVRSTKSFTAYRWGHKWVVLAVLVQFPFATRPWALPVLVALYRSPKWNQHSGRRHKTPARLLRQLTAVLLRWFPHRHFTLAGDGGYGSHEMARFAHRHRRRLKLVSRFCPDANRYEPPPVVAGKRNG